MSDSQGLSPGKLQGWLFLRSRLTKKWRKRWFEMQRNILSYGVHPNKLHHKVYLGGARILQSSKDNKEFAFRIEPRNGHRTFHVHAQTEEERTRWMQAICFAKMTQSDDDDETTKSKKMILCRIL